MIILAIDTSGSACAVCVYDADDRDGGGKVLAKSSENIGKGHAELLMDIIRDVMGRAKIGHSDLHRVVVSTGPGSFTGVRVGVATARGFGLGLGIPVIGVTILEGILEQAREAGHQGPLGVLQKTGRDEVYAQFTCSTGFNEAGIPFLVGIDDLVNDPVMSEAELKLCGNAAQEIAARCDNYADGTNVVETPANSLIEIIARLGASKKEDGTRPEPLYLRKPDAKPQSGFAVSRS